MGDVVALNNLVTPAQVISTLSEEDLKAAENIVVLRLDKEGEVYVSYNRMAPERMYYLGGVLQRYALNL